MAITSDNETRQTHETVVSIRIPNGADGDLATEAAKRLSRADGVTDVTVDGLCGLEPGLSATVVTVALVVETTGERAGPTVDEAIGALTGVEAIIEPTA